MVTDFNFAKMLSSLYIQNYAIIDKLNVDFHSGLNIITGETGAGKSIILGALGLILGKRADTSVLKNEEKKCVVEAEFNVKLYKLEAIFNDNELDYEDVCQIRREINANGKSRAFINDTPVNLGLLSQIAGKFIDIHSQHQTLLLNRSAFQMQVIDSYAGTFSMMEEYKKFFNEYITSKKKYEQAKADVEAIKNELDFYNHQLQELESAKLQTGELEALEDELGMLEHAEDIKLAVHNIDNHFNEEEIGIIARLKSVQSSIENIKKFQHTAVDLQKRIESSFIELKDLSNEIAGIFEKIEHDPERIELVRNRVSLIYNLIQKYKVESAEELLEKQLQLKEKVSVATDSSVTLADLKKQLDTAENAVRLKASEISKKRLACINSLSINIVETLTQLGMPNTLLEIRNSVTPITINGIDEFTFLFSANSNHAPQEMGKIASGGELSRLMLAIKYHISNSVELPTIIFDEIDTGVSGEVAHKVGEIIHKMAGGMQVVNITHLPQVASKGDYHFLVYKHNVDNLTQTNMRLLTSEERLQEIAKMLSGSQITDAALKNAKELLNT